MSLVENKAFVQLAILKAMITDRVSNQTFEIKFGLKIYNLLIIHTASRADAEVCLPNVV